MDTPDIIGGIIYGLILVVLVLKFIQAIRIVPTQEVFIVERWGKYAKNLGAGFHTLIPFMHNVAYKLSLKEEAIDVPSQICITADNVQIAVDGIVYMKVVDPVKAAYEITNYKYAVIQLAQTSMRAVFGRMDLDKTFEERDAINAKIVQVVDEAAEHWGVDILRYEIQNIQPSQAILDSMEKQMTAERDKRAVIAESEGAMTSKINRSQGLQAELVNRSEGEKMKKINEAEGRAREIESVATATATGILKVAESLQLPGGMEAMRLNISEDYLRKLAGLAKPDTDLILPMDLSNMGSVLDNLDEAFKKKS